MSENKEAAGASCGCLLFLVLACGFGAFIIGGIAGAIVGESTGASSWDMAAPIFGAAGLIIGVVLWAAEIRAERKGQAQRKREESQKIISAQNQHAARTRRNNEDAQQAWLDACQSDALRSAERAVGWFARMPGHLTSARTFRNEAASSFEDGAYSPFWAAIERSYAEVAQYRECVRQVADLSSQHAEAVAALAAAKQHPSALAQFPVHLEVDNVRRVIDTATADLSALAYQAQRDATFALIWEQRRTTAAVIAGFTNLEAAIQGMRGAVVESLDRMGLELQHNSSQIKASMISLSLSNTSHNNTGQNSDTMRQLARRADQIRNELYRQNWGHYPLL